MPFSNYAHSDPKETLGPVEGMFLGSRNKIRKENKMETSREMNANSNNTEASCKRSSTTKKLLTKYVLLGACLMFAGSDTNIGARKRPWA